MFIEFAKKMLSIIDGDLELVNEEKKELDKQYIDKQKRERQLLKAREEVVAAIKKEEAALE